MPSSCKKKEKTRFTGSSRICSEYLSCYVNIDPALMYHTLATLIYERIPSRGLRGFGFGANSGFVPIPTANEVLPNLYDYYGYGFDPFLKKLHNPPSYFVNDYSGYGYSLYH